MSKTKIFLLLLAVALLLSLTVVAFAADGGSEVENPIADRDALESLAAAAPGTYTLTDDLTLEDWTSIVLPAGVILEGNGKTITGLTTALFTEVYGTVKNLTISDAVVTGSGIFANNLCDGAELYNVHVNGNLTGGSFNAGGIAGDAAGNITIQNCTVSGTITSNTKGAGVGGFIGKYNQPSGKAAVEVAILNCTNKANITVTSQSTGTAGFIGQCYNGAANDKVYISNCVNDGVITVKNTGGNAGGFLGYVPYLGKLHIEYCTNTADIVDSNGTKGSYAAGIISNLNKCHSLVMSYCANLGDIFGVERAGGLIGNLGQTTDSAGCRIEYSKNVGAVIDAGINGSNLNYVGGLVAYAQYNARSLSFLGCANFGEVKNTKIGAAGGILGALESNGYTIKFEVVKNSGNVESVGNAGGLVGVTGKNIKGAMSISATSILQTGNVSGKVAGGFFGSFSMAGYNLTINATALVLDGTVTGQEAAANFMAQCTGAATCAFTFENVMSDATVTAGGAQQNNPVHTYDNASASLAELTIGSVVENVTETLNQAANALEGTYPTWEQDEGEKYPTIHIVTAGFTVIFYDRDGNILSIQMVEEGKAAIAPYRPPFNAQNGEPVS